MEELKALLSRVEFVLLLLYIRRPVQNTLTKSHSRPLSGQSDLIAMVACQKTARTRHVALSLAALCFAVWLHLRYLRILMSTHWFLSFFSSLACVLLVEMGTRRLAVSKIGAPGHRRGLAGAFPCLRECPIQPGGDVRALEMSNQLAHAYHRTRKPKTETRAGPVLGT